MAGPIVFELTADERKRLQRSLSKASSGAPQWLFPAMTLVYGLQLGTALVGHRAWLTIVYVGAFVVSVLLTLRNRRMRFPLLPIQGSFELSDSGLAGTLDGVPVTIGWSDVEMLRDLDDAIFILRRRNQSPIAIPKGSFSDLGTFWQLLEDRLVSKRGLIRSAAPRRAISNSAY